MVTIQPQPTTKPLTSCIALLQPRNHSLINQTEKPWYNENTKCKGLLRFYFDYNKCKTNLIRWTISWIRWLLEGESLLWPPLRGNSSACWKFESTHEVDKVKLIRFEFLNKLGRRNAPSFTHFDLTHRITNGQKSAYSPQRWKIDDL